MVRRLNAGRGGAAVPGVRYTTIPTRYDELVVPYTSGVLHARNVVNHVLQTVCPNDWTSMRQRRSIRWWRS